MALFGDGLSLHEKYPPIVLNVVHFFKLAGVFFWFVPTVILSVVIKFAFDAIESWYCIDSDKNCQACS